MSDGGKSKERKISLIALPLFLLLSCVATWPLAVSPHPHDKADTLFNSWLISWNNHALLNGLNPLDLPIFESFEDGNGRNDLLLTQSLIALPLRFLGMESVRVHNILLVLFLLFAGYASALLAAETGASENGSLFTGSVVILLPYFQSHVWHLQLFSVGFSLLTLVYALRVLNGKCKGWQLSLLVFFQCLASLYQWYFLNLAILLLTLSTLFISERKKLPRLLICWLAGNIAAVPFLVPHLANAQAWSINSIASTDISAFFAPWGNSFLLDWMRMSFVHPEAALWPGLAVVAGSVWFLFKGRKTKSDLFLMACIIFFALFSMGPTLVAFGKAIAPGPFRLLTALPGCGSIRLPARAAIFFLVPLAIFAGRKLESKPWMIYTGIIITLAFTLHPPLTVTPTPQLPWHTWLSGQDFDRVLYLPMSSDMDMPQVETKRLYGSVTHFTPSVNGYSTTLPEEYRNYANVLNSWPSAEAKQLAEDLGVNCIILKGSETQEADTVFSTDRVSVSAVILD